LVGLFYYYCTIQEISNKHVAQNFKILDELEGPKTFNCSKDININYVHPVQGIAEEEKKNDISMW
jgi:hypothetical protein